VGKTYQVILGVSTISTGDKLIYRIGSTVHGYDYADASLASGATPSDYKRIFTATGTTCYVTFGNYANPLGSFTEFNKVTVKEVLGSHASQTNPVKRPKLEARGDTLVAVWDGVDDCLVVPTLDLSITDKLTCLYGYSTTIGGSDAVLLELTSRFDINNGSFNQVVTGPRKLQFGHRANSAWSEAYSDALPAGPYQSVTSVAYDLSGTAYATELPSLRVNGAAITPTFSGAADTGSGNFASAVFYIGQRNGTSFPFTGAIQSITLIPALITASETAVIEASVNNSMGKVY